MNAFYVGMPVVAILLVALFADCASDIQAKMDERKWEKQFSFNRHRRD